MMKGGLIIMGDLPKWKMKGGLIVMGDLPKKIQRFFQKKLVSLLRVTYLDGKI
jgi:hypothetical protein